MSEISEETHEFRQGENSCLYSTIRFLIQVKNTIDNGRLAKLVEEKITRINESSKKDLCNATDGNNKITKKTSSRITNMKTTDNENELKALVSLCRKIICVVFIRKNDEVASSLHVRYYDEYFLPFKECVYIIYDEIHKTYSPLYLINKSNADESRTIFVRKDHMINILLRKFFKDHLKYNKFVPLDDQIDTMVSEVLPHVQNASDNIPGIIALNTEKNTTKKQMTTKAAECLIMSNSTTSTSNTNADAQLLSNVKTKISNTTQEFRRISVPADGSCLYWSFIDIFGKSKKINVKDLRNKVAGYIYDMDIDDVVLLSDTGCRNRAQFCDKIRKNDWAGEVELLALSEMHSVVIGVVNKVINEQGRLSVNLINYGESNQSFEKCVYIIYDRPAEHYEPLYLCDKNNPNEYVTIFDRYDPVVKNLLEDFIEKQCHCGGYDGTLGDVRMCRQDDISNKSIDDSHSTASSIIMDISQKEIVSVNYELPPIKTTTSNEIYEFRIGELPGDDLCLFSCAIYSFDRSQTINIKSLRKKVADHIREWKEIDDIRLLSGTGCQTREEYCRKIEEGTICGSEPERHALAYLYPNILFCLISNMTYDENESSVHIDTYVKDISLYTRCVIIVYDVAANNYLPLYLYDKIKQEEKKTNFKYDGTVTKLLGEFIRKTFSYYDYINFDGQCTSDDGGSPSHVESEFVDILNKISMNTITNISKKRKICEDDDDDDAYLLNVNVITNKSTAITNQGHQSLKYSRSLPAADVTSKLDNQKDIPVDIAELLQTDFIVLCNAMEQQQPSFLSMVVSSNTEPIDNEQEGEKMRLEIEPMKSFRGRTRHEYKPKNARRRNGEPSKVNPPSYVADRRNNHWLSLLISQTYLFSGCYQIVLEICIVTGDINGCIYVNPYFKFQIDHKNRESRDFNPMFMRLQENELKTTSFEGMRKILLYLVVVKLTESELKLNQPIKIFPSTKFNGRAFIKDYQNVDQFKQAYHLDEIRFAFTLWIKRSSDKRFFRHGEMQYISEVSTQHAKATVSNNGG